MYLIPFFLLFSIVFCEQYSIQSGGCGANCNLEQNEKNDIIRIHNKLRSKIAKGQFIAKGKQMQPAMNMRKMVWSDELAVSSKAYASQCFYGHSNRNGKNSGENLYMKGKMKFGGSGPLAVAGIGAEGSNAWAAEFQSFGWPNVRMADFVRNPHAVQMAWASSEKVGCGIAQCQDASTNDVHLVCQYSPSGHNIFEFSYKEGATCSQCGNGYRCEQATGLCVK